MLNTGITLNLTHKELTYLMRLLRQEGLKLDKDDIRRNKDAAEAFKNITLKGLHAEVKESIVEINSRGTKLV
jgi:hypothetical protein